ncbi:MAG TPA: cellulase family glycosylhydrolase [Polyangiaceae bacterium]
MNANTIRASFCVLSALTLAACDTDEATQVTATSARLNLKDPITDCSASNPCKWYYELTANQAIFDGSPAIPTGSTADNVPATPKVWNGDVGAAPDPSVVKTGLTPNTRYYFRVCGARGAGPFYCGTVQSFVTMEGLKLSADKSRFVLDVSGTEVIPFGYTYHQPDAAGAEILRITSWNMTTFASDVDEMKQLGANTIRIRPQIGELMSGPSTLNTAGVSRLMAVLDVLERKNVYVDIVGLADYARDPTPWYESLDETGRHAAQEFFWTRIAAAVKSSPAVFALNLINEPLVPASAVDSWRFGSMDNGNYWFCNYLVKDRGTSSPVDVLREWLRRMSTAIRSTNSRHLITFGAWEQWHADGAWMKDYIDFYEPHIYPKSAEPAHNVPASLAIVAAWAGHGRPVFIGETSNFGAGRSQQSRFIKSMRPYVKGVLSHYYGTPPWSANCSGDVVCAIRRDEGYDMADVSPFFRALTTAGRRTTLRRFVNVTPVPGKHLHSESTDINVDTALAFRINVWNVPYAYSAEPDTGILLKVAEANTAALVRFWAKSTRTAIYLPDPSETDVANAALLGYEYDRLLGFMHKTPVSGTAALHKCTSSNDEILQKSATCPSGYALRPTPLGYVF